MANRSFVVQYLIKAREQFSEAADRTRKATRSMREEMERARKTFDKAGAAMQRAGVKLSLGVTTPLAFIGISLKNAARDAEETRSKFGTVFQDISGAAQKSARDLAMNYGLANTKSKELLGNTGDLLTGFGFSQEAALKLSTEVNQLAVDLASFTNFSGGAEGASAALTKALLGERESVKSLGISILETDVKLKMAEMASKGLRFETERQAKAQATLLLAMEQSKNAIGDFARTKDQLANQERILAARVQDLKEAFGDLLLPVSLKVTQALRSMVETLSDMSPGMKKAVLIVAALAATVGPLLIMLGTMVKLWPLMTIGARLFGMSALSALLPFLPVIAAVAAGAALIIAYWDELKAFFRGFAMGLDEGMGGTLTKLVDNFKEAARIIAGAFGSDSEASKSLGQFTEVGRLMGAIIGNVVRLLVNGLSGVGAILGQLVASAVSLDFSNFDVDAIKAEFLGTPPEATAGEARVDFNATIGLDKGLKQTGDASVAGAGVRRLDVGMN